MALGRTQRAIARPATTDDLSASEERLILECRDQGVRVRRIRHVARLELSVTLVSRSKIVIFASAPPLSVYRLANGAPSSFSANSDRALTGSAPRWIPCVEEVAITRDDCAGDGLRDP